MRGPFAIHLNIECRKGPRESADFLNLFLMCGEYIRDKIYDFIPNKLDCYPDRRSRDNGLLYLTDKGNAFIVSLGFDKFFVENKNEFFAFIDEEESKLKYDVELSAMKAIYFLMDKPFMNFLKH
jgi:hypothetical protein